MFIPSPLADIGKQCHTVTNALWWAHVRLPSAQHPFGKCTAFQKSLVSTQKTFLSGLVAQSDQRLICDVQSPDLSTESIRTWPASVKFPKRVLM